MKAPMRRLILVSATTLAVLLIPSAPLHAQYAAISLSLDPSVRAAGMGPASTAVFWGHDPNLWANPALLGYHQGVRYEWGETQLVPDRADDVFLTTKRLTVSAFGAGLLIEGKPSWELGRRLDYGRSEARSETGEFLGEFESWETIKSWGFAFNTLELVGGLLEVAHVELPALHRMGDLSFGHVTNDVFVSLVPDELAGAVGSGSGGTKTQDWGLLARVTPYNSIDGPGYLSGLDSFLLEGQLGVRVDAAYGRAENNYEEAAIDWGYGGPIDTAYASEREGFSALLTLSASHAKQQTMREEGSGWLLDLFHPLLAAGLAWDEESFRVPVTTIQGGARIPAPIDTRGWELTLANVLSLRHGHIDDPDGSIHGSTSGWSLGVQFAGMAGIRYDSATRPQACDPSTGECFDDVHRKAVTGFVDPLAVWRYFRSRPGS